MTLRVLPAGAIGAGVHTTLSDATLADVVDRVADEPASAEFRLDLDYDHANGRLTRVDLTMWLSVDMPEWTQAARRPGAERDEWERFLRALRHHENGHIDIYRREAQRTYDALLRARPRTINRDLAAEERRIRRLSAAYDVRTDHGRSQQTPHGTTIIQVPAAPPAPPDELAPRR